MAWNPAPEVAAARDIAKKFNKKQVVILMLDDEKIQSVSYGETKKLCDATAKLADVAYNAVYEYLESIL